MTIAPPITTITPGLAAILTRHGRDADWLNTEDGNPWSAPNIARAELARCEAQIPWHYRDATADHPAVHTWANELADAARNSPNHTVAPLVYRGPSLLALGPTGTGKTHLAYGAMREIAVTGVRNAWIATTAADLYASLRPRAGVDSETEFRRYANARLLVLDDLGAAKDTEWTEEINYRLINHRYEQSLPMLVTSNVPSAELRAKLGERVASRLVGMCTPIALVGTDRRRIAA